MTDWRRGSGRGRRAGYGSTGAGRRRPTTVCDRYARSGNKRARPSALASVRPRSVIRPVSNLAGVTSKAGLAAGLLVGTTRTVVTTPSMPRPVIVVTSEASRSSIGIAAPSVTDQSMVLEGAATQNGTRLSRAARALRYVPILF